MSDIKSKSDKFLLKRGIALQSSLADFGTSQASSHMSDGIPQVSSLMAKNVSQYRREILGNEVKQGLFADGSGSSSNENRLTSNGVVSSSIGIVKQAQVVSGGNYQGGNGDVAKQAPEVYSPLWLNSNLSLPRDRPTINAWCRSFYALNPFVHNAISLHSTYPISKLNIKCPNKDIEKFFNNMIEETDLMNICVQIAQEYWLLGEAFVYAELDESKGKWSRLLIQNPDYMRVKRTVVASEPKISLRPDENLKKIIFSNRPADIEQRKQLNQYIIDSVKHGEDITLDNFNVSHLARRISPYEIRGTGLPVCVFRQLMLFDKLKECYSMDTEVLTDKGFKTIDQLTHKTLDIKLNPNYVNGIELDNNGQISSILTMKEDFKVACVNPDTNEIEYHKPIELHMSKYTGKMLHFSSKKIDTLVSPNHKMWVSQRHGNNYSNYEKINAQNLLKQKNYKLQGTAFWQGNNDEEVMILNKLVNIDDYLKFIGTVISEGCVDTGVTKSTGYTRGRIIVSQLTCSKHQEAMRLSMINFIKNFDLHLTEEIKIRGSGFSKHAPKEAWIGTITNKQLTNFIKNEIGFDNKCDSKHKKIPRWVLNLSSNKLNILIDAMLAGDGNIETNLDGYSYKYSTACKELADDVQELLIKCNKSPIISSRPCRTCTEYTIAWSDNIRGKNPIIYNNNSIQEIDYSGVVWCFEVPTGLFITRRNGKFAILGNSKYAQAENMINPLTLVKIGSADFKPTYADLEAWRTIFSESQADKDFKIFTHEGVSVEKIGSGQGIYDISGDVTQCLKEIFIGLQVPSVLMDGGADTTYANAGVALDVLRQRYMQFRNMMSIWLKRKIFAPISKIQGFYDYSGGEKQLIVPDVDWNHMSLFDAGDYINTLVTLTQGEGPNKRASLQTLYRSLGLEYEDEIRKLRKEAIQDEIHVKEKAALSTMSLNELRTLDEEDEIPEPINKAPPQEGAPPSLPGETSSLPGLDMGSSAPPPPAPSSPPPGL
jgi:hypothetical protein